MNIILSFHEIEYISSEINCFSLGGSNRCPIITVHVTTSFYMPRLLFHLSRQINLNCRDLELVLLQFFLNVLFSKNWVIFLLKFNYDWCGLRLLDPSENLHVARQIF